MQSGLAATLKLGEGGELLLAPNPVEFPACCLEEAACVRHSPKQRSDAARCSGRRFAGVSSRPRGSFCGSLCPSRGGNSSQGLLAVVPVGCADNPSLQLCFIPSTCAQLASTQGVFVGRPMVIDRPILLIKRAAMASPICELTICSGYQASGLLSSGASPFPYPTPRLEGASVCVRHSFAQVPIAHAASHCNLSGASCRSAPQWIQKGRRAFGNWWLAPPLRVPLELATLVSLASSRLPSATPLSPVRECPADCRRKVCVKHAMLGELEPWREGIAWGWL